MKLWILIMNDCQTIPQEILKTWKQRFKNKNSHNEKNLGLTKSLNILINNATGQLIARQDADDYSTEDRLSTQVAF